MLTASRIVLYESITEAYGEVRIAVMGRFLLTLKNSLGQQMLVIVNGGTILADAILYLCPSFRDTFIVQEYRVGLFKG